MPSSGLWKQAQQGLRSAASTAVSGGLDARSERPASGYGQPRPTPLRPALRRTPPGPRGGVDLRGGTAREAVAGGGEGLALEVLDR